jgi:hypothetical protein
MASIYENLNLRFRNLTDLLFYSDRLDLDLSEYKLLYKENRTIHSTYILNVFKRTSDIFWENNDSFWVNRLTFIFSLNEKHLSEEVSSFIQKRMLNLIKFKPDIDIKYDVEFQQFVAYCKVKLQRGEDLSLIKEQFLSLPSNNSAERLMQIVPNFIPIFYKDINEYLDYIIKRIPQSGRNFELLLELEEMGLCYNKAPIFSLAKELLLERPFNDKNRRALFSLLYDDAILASLKKIEHPIKDRLLGLLNTSSYKDIEDRHFSNVKHLLELDPSLSDDVANIYATRLYARGSGHRKSNADRLIRLLTLFPQIQPKKVLAFLSSNNKMIDIKYMLSAFPELRKLAAFV